MRVSETSVSAPFTTLKTDCPIKKLSHRDHKLPRKSYLPEIFYRKTTSTKACLERRERFPSRRNGPDRDPTAFGDTMRSIPPPSRLPHWKALSRPLATLESGSPAEWSANTVISGSRRLPRANVRDEAFVNFKIGDILISSRWATAGRPLGGLPNRGGIPNRPVATERGRYKIYALSTFRFADKDSIIFTKLKEKKF